MINKTYLIILIVTISSAPRLFSQSLSFCNSTGSKGQMPYHKNPASLSLSDEDPFVINIIFHNNDTEIPVILNQSDYSRAVGFLNQNYNQFNIFFKYRGFDESATAVDNMVNIFISSGSGGSSGTSSALVTYQSFIDDDRRFILAHENGHLLNLEHPNGGTNFDVFPLITSLNCNGTLLFEGSFPVYNDVADPTIQAPTEHVTRDTTSEDYNALDAGDFIHDTAATFQNVNLCITVNGSTPQLNYLFSTEVVDPVGIPYDNINVTNIMDNDLRQEFYPFKTAFTAGQGNRMRVAITNDLVIQSWEAPVSSLYEPYLGSYYNTGPITLQNKPLFQPGFDYLFISAGRIYS